MAPHQGCFCLYCHWLVAISAVVMSAAHHFFAMSHIVVLVSQDVKSIHWIDDFRLKFGHLDLVILIFQLLWLLLLKLGANIFLKDLDMQMLLIKAPHFKWTSFTFNNFDRPHLVDNLFTGSTDTLFL